MKRTIALGAFGLILAWQVITTTFVAYLAETRPETALRFKSSDASALMALAQTKLDAEFAGGVVAPQSRLMPRADDQAAVRAENFGRLGAFAQAAQAAAERGDGAAVATGSPPAEPIREATAGRPAALSDSAKAAAEQIKSWVRAALVSDPANARGYRILGQIASIEGRDDDAEKLMGAAVKHSLRESIAVHWLMRRAIDGQDYARAGYYLDTLLRTHPQLRDAALPSLVQIAETEKGSAVVKDLLARNPPWRASLFNVLSLAVTDARTPLGLLLHLKTTSHPPTAADIQPYLDFLIARKFYDLAYDTWLQFLPDEQLSSAGLLFNNRFQFPLSGLPFDWRILTKSGVLADIVPLPEGKGSRALSLEFRNGQIDFPGVTQTVLLRPGTYQFKGRHKGTLVGRRGLKWRVACVDQPSVNIGESGMFVGVLKNWEAFSFAFTVPAKACGAQELRLELDARSASERLVSGTMLFADFEIVQDANAEAAKN